MSHGFWRRSPHGLFLRSPHGVRGLTAAAAEKEFGAEPNYGETAHAGDYAGTWVGVNGVTWVQWSDTSWEDCQAQPWAGWNYRTSYTETVRIQRFYAPPSTSDWYRGNAAMRYGNVGAGHPGDPGDLSEVTEAYVDILFEWLERGGYPYPQTDTDQEIGVFMATGKLTNPNSSLTLNCGPNHGTGKNIHISHADCNHYSPGDPIRIHMTSGTTAQMTGEQQVVDTVTQGAPGDPATAHYLTCVDWPVIDHLVSRGARVWGVEDQAAYLDGDVEFLAYLTTNNAITQQRVYLNPDTIFSAIINDQTLDLFFTPLALGDEPANRFFCAVYPWDIEYQYNNNP